MIQVTVTHRLDPQLDGQVRYALYLLAKIANKETVDAGDLAAALPKVEAHLAALKASVKKNQP